MPINNRLLLQIIDILTELTVYESMDFKKFLDKTITIVNKIIESDSVLIYVYDRQKKKLTLAASKNPKSKLIGKIVLKNSEGLTGWVVENKKSLAISEKAYKDKRFKTFKELPEDKYEAFLSVPIVGRDGVIGVINIQNREVTNYRKLDIKMIEGIGKIISTAFGQIVLNQKLVDIEDEIKTAKVINKAKALLMKEKNISEDQAYRLMQKEAMNRRKPMKEIAQAVIMVFSDLKG